MRKSPWFLGGLAALLLFAPSAAQDAAESCTSLAGTIDAVSVPRLEGEALVGFDLTGTGATGPLADMEVTARFDVERFLADGSVVITGSHRFAGGALGDFASRDQGMTSATGAVVNRMELTEGASGFLITHGPIDLETGTLSLEYLGVHCAGA